MRFSSVAVLALASGAALLLPACSGGGPTAPVGATASGFARVARWNVSGNGAIPAALKPPQRLAVTNFSNPGYFDGVVVLNRRYKQIQSITSGAAFPSGAHYDSKGNLYIANLAGPNVTEYNKKGTLTFTYSSGLGDPGGVTVDHHGNVYVSDWGDDKASVVVEYPQGSNKPLTSCSTGYANAGVAIDGKGHIFVSVDTPQKGSNAGFILEYKGGLSGCKAITLGVNLGAAGHLTIDRHKNLVVCDRQSGAVDIIPPPYTKVDSTITAGISGAVDVALNKQQSLLYVVNFPYPTDDLVVDTYPSGTNVTTLGASEGLLSPQGVAAYPQ